LELNDYQRHLYHVIAPVGGVFDFYTGRVKLPPKWIQKMGLIFSTAFSGTAAPFAAPVKDIFRLRVLPISQGWPR